MKSRCPVCDNYSSKEHAPFCSLRCADIDLGRWFTGRYAIPAEEEDTLSPHDEDDDLPH